MPVFTEEISGLDDLLRRFNAIGAADKLKEGLTRGLIGVQNATIRKLSGPVLKNRTGTLRRSIHYRLVEDEKGIDGVVGSFAGNVNPKSNEEAYGYARVHEYGGTFNVPAHERRIGYNSDSERVKLLGKLGGFSKKVATYSTTMVRAHTVTYPERSFLRSSLSEQKKNIVKELKLSMDEALSGQGK